ncbi:endothelin-converting enzyme homolog isoform X2 [Penaeus japonicus]|uniref:endothelin-converting enzyme homolog isoform X2 n=1 Tax=Penaeus japonicus TaxID=27405 RepID=UPI001C70E67A|nr:endothelin-converting enzyme homolog isoform X2 [Penaeus japonicus]
MSLKFKKIKPAIGSLAERQPIMMTPVDLPMRNYDDVTTAGDQSPARNDSAITLPTNYNSIQVHPLPVAALRDADGGYVGPAAIPPPPRQSPPLPRAHGNAHEHVRRPQNGTADSQRERKGAVGGEENGGLQGFLRRRTPCERNLAVAVVVLAGVLACLGGILQGAPRWLRLSPMTRDDTCNTRECVRAAGDILDGLDESADPCEDFVRFACGGWLREHPIPSLEYRWGLFDTLEERTVYDIKGLLEKEYEENEAFPVRAAKIAFKACVNNTAWSEVGLKPLLALLEKEGGLPMLDSGWSGDGFDLVTSLARIRRLYGGLALVSVAVEMDSTNTSANVIQLGQGLLQMRRESFLESNSSTHKDKYLTYMHTSGAQMLLELGRDSEEAAATLTEDSLNMWNFSVALAKITLPDENLTDPWVSYNPTTVDELQRKTDEAAPGFKFEWLRFLQETFREAEVEITGEERIVVEVPDYLTGMVRILKETPKRVLANYLLMQLVQGMADEVVAGTRDDYRQLHPGTNIKSFGRTSGRAWYDCAQKTNKILDMAVGYMYIQNRVDDNVASTAREVVEDIKGAFRSMLTTATWMGSAREEALRKVDNMLTLVAYPDMLTNATSMEEYHKSLPKMDEGKHFDNMIALSQWHSLRSLAKLRKAVVRDGWARGPVETNAFYSTLQNSIIIPVAVLQPPIFRREPLTALNYGALGVVVGHEVTHGFDNMGRERDHEGNLHEWWTAETDAEYALRSTCFADQYEAFDVSQILAPFERDGLDLKINGIASKGENIADNGGTRAAWLAYKNRVESSGERLRLPGLESYSQDQLFFISFGQLWCSQFTPWSLKFLLSTDVHIPGAFRIKGVLQNLREFSHAFECGGNSTFNPERKCQLW